MFTLSRLKLNRTSSTTKVFSECGAPFSFECILLSGVPIIGQALKNCAKGSMNAIVISLLSAAHSTVSPDCGRSFPQKCSHSAYLLCCTGNWDRGKAATEMVTISAQEGLKQEETIHFFLVFIQTE